MNTLFISDLHLQDGQDESLQALLNLLAGPALDSDAVYILGDLFEFWIGDDAVSDCAQQVASATRELSNRGVACHFMHGNRDFLLGPAYAEHAGLNLLPETQVVDLYGRPTLLLHGDTLCTDDVEYQAFRQQSRHPAWQAGVLALSIEERLQLARNARDASKDHMAGADMAIMDVNPQAVKETFLEHGVQHMIHGHTHRPAVHQHDLDGGQQGERIVLADWYAAGSYLKVGPDGSESIPLA